MRPCLRLVLLPVLLAAVAGGGPPGRSGKDADAVVIWTAAAGGGAARGTPRVGDRVLAASAAGRSFPMDTPVDWLWFRAEWAPRGAVTLTLRRGSRTFQAPVPPGSLPGAGPSLPPSLAREARAMLADPVPGGAGPVDPGPLEKRIRRAAGDRALFWFQLSLARALLARGGFHEAPAVSQRALATGKRLEDRRARLLALEVRAAALLAADDLEGAAGAARRLLALAEKPGEPDLLRAAALETLGRALCRRGLLSQARERLSEALAIRRRLAPGSLAEAASLEALAEVNRDQGATDRALELLHRAMDIQEARAPGSLELARSLNTLGGIHLAAGELRAARRALERSLEIRRGLPGAPGTFRSLYNLALVAYQERRLDECSELLARSRRALQRRGAPDRLMAKILDAQMLVAMERGDHARAERLGKEALAVHSRLDPGSLDTAACLTNLGALASRQGDTTRARARYLRALEIVRKEAPAARDLPMILANLGDLALAEGDPERALPRFREAMDRLQALGAPEISMAQLHQNMAHAALELDRLEEAEREALAALAIRRRAAAGSREEATSLHLLGAIRARQGRLREADRLYARAEAILRGRAPGTVDLAEVLHSIAELRLREGRREAATEALTEAIRALEEQMLRLGGTDTVRSAFRERYAGWYRRLEELLVAAGRPAEAYHVLERSRARTLAAMLTERDIPLGTGRVRRLDVRRRELAARYDTLLARLASAPAAERAELNRRLEAVRLEQDELRSALRRASPRLASLRYPAPLDAARAGRLLPPHGAALAYSIGEGRSLLFVVRPDGTVATRSLPVDRAGLERMVDLYRGLILRPGDTPEGAAALARARNALSRLLLDPAAELLQGVTTLVILPDGPLHRLPFATLRLGSRTVCERAAVCVVPSMSVLAELHGEDTRPAAGSPLLLAMANPGPLPANAPAGGLRGGSREPLPPVPGTVEEARAIARLWRGPCTLLTGAEATEHRFVALAPHARVVHLAAHMLLDGEHPLDSAVVLAPDPLPEHSNGLLQGWEVMESLRLRGSLVTLSGCEAGLGREQDGEGLLGLTRAFHYAGARSVLGSLWRVDDAATVLLMRRVYAHLCRGLTVAEALRATQEELLHEPAPSPGLLPRIGRFLGLRPRGASPPPHAPAVWAAFELSGDPAFTLR